MQPVHTFCMNVTLMKFIKSDESEVVIQLQRMFIFLRVQRQGCYTFPLFVCHQRYARIRRSALL